MSAECKRPGKKTPALAPAWQEEHAIAWGSAGLLWNIGIGSISRRAVSAVIEVDVYVGICAVTATSRDRSRTPSGAPTPPPQSPPGSVPALLKYLTKVFAATVAWWHEKQSAVPLMAWSKLPGSRLAALASPRTRSGRCVAWQAMQVLAASDVAEWLNFPPVQFCVPPEAPLPGPVWQVAQSRPAPCVAKSNGEVR